MPRRLKRKPIGGRRVRRKRVGGSAFTDFFTKTLPKTARKVGSFIKDKKLVSTILGAIPHPAASAASKVANAVGLGRRRRRKVAKPMGMGRRKVMGGRRPMRGGLSSLNGRLFLI